MMIGMCADSIWCHGFEAQGLVIFFARSEVCLQQFYACMRACRHVGT